MKIVLNRLLDILYPPRCVSCGRDGDWWCADCRTTVEATPRQPCPRCLSIEPSHFAHGCDGALPFHAVITTGFYHSPPLRTLIAAVKYDGVTAAASSMEAYLRAAVAIPSWLSEPDVVMIPMPLSNTRLRERGFNQAQWIAEQLSGVTGVTVHREPILIRRKGAAAQADLEHNVVLRSANVKGQFQATSRLNRPVVLIDDVVTTGSTAAEAARALLAAGAPRVYLFTLAVGK